MKWKIRTFFLVLFLMVIHDSLKAQQISWFQPDHEWFYTRWCITPPFPCGYFQFTVVGDAQVGGQDAVEVFELEVDEQGNTLSNATHYFRASGDSVFHYYAPSDIWYLLYSFNTPVGETWVVQGDEYVGYDFPPSPDLTRFEVLVDSITTINIGGVERRRIYTSPAPLFPPQPGFQSIAWFEQIIEGIGAVGATLFGDQGMPAIGDPPRFSCFFDVGGWQYGSFGVPCLSVGLNEEVIGEISVFPNPAHHRFSFILPEIVTDIVEVRLYDLLGRLVFEKRLNAAVLLEFPIPELTSGLYLLHVRTDQGILSGKLAVER